MQTKKILKITGIISGVIVLLTGAFIGVYLLVIAPSFVGKTGPEGDMLKKYIEPAALRELTINPVDNIWIIDVRPEEAYKKGHIPTAKSFYSGAIMSRLDELPKEKYLIIYCETGGRVEAVIKKLKKAGYTRYMNWGANYRWRYERGGSQ